MRNFRKSWIGIVLVFLFTISLFFWRQGSYISNILNSDNIIAKVGNTPISTTKFNRTLDMNIQQFNQILKKKLSGEDVRNLQIHQLAIGALVKDAIFENEYNELDFKLDDTIIAKKTKEIIPQLYNNNNELDENYLKQFLSEQRLQVEDIVQIVHFETRDKFFNENLLDINYPNFFSKNIEIYNNHQRDIEYLKIPIKIIDINDVMQENKILLDDKLNDFYKKNISQYMSEEKRSIKYILINKDDYTNSFIPTEKEIFEYYNNNTDLFFDNEKRSFIQFNFQSMEKAKETENKLNNIHTYKNIITYANQEKIKYNNFVNVAKDEVLDEIANPLFALEINEKSKIIKSPIAYHIIILSKINPSNQLSLKEVQRNITETISNIETMNYLTDLENNISQNILDGFNLEQISNKYDLKISFLDNITINHDKYNQNQKLFFTNIIDNAFNANLDFINDIVKLDQDKFYIYKVVQILESQPLNFNDIKDIVLSDWKKSKQIEKIQFIVNNNKSNNNFLKDIERNYSLKIENKSINSSNTNIPKQFVKEIFKSDINSIIHFISKDEVHLSKVLRINFINESEETKTRISLLNEIKNSLTTELLKNTKISTNDNLLNSIINNY